MEIYEFNNQNKTASLYLGKYFELIHGKHKKQYGEAGAKNIYENIEETFKHCQNQILQNPQNPNVLLVGKVQSGKTSNLELFAALAFDNGFNFVVIYGGYDNTLLDQTTKRFIKNFDIPADIDYSDSSPVIFSSDDSTTLLNVTDKIIADLIEEQKPIFLVSMKQPAAMRKINQLLKKIDRMKIKSFIIDDEGDQASLNTKKNKTEDASATYAEICRMKELLSNPLYLSVTATPQANIFLNEYSRLKPSSIRLIEPGKGYCGAEVYHLSEDSDIVYSTLNSSDADALVDEMPVSLKKALCHYFLASAVLFVRGIKDSDMIIHTHRTVNEHEIIYNRVNQIISNYQDNIKYKQTSEVENLISELEDYFNLSFPKTRDSLSFADLKDIVIEQVIPRIHIILKNSAGKTTQGNESSHRYKIHIGGDLLQRGLTFKHLVATYFLRWAKNGGNMDTNLQRARWFGYRSKYIDVCKIFTVEEIAEEFTNLAQMEEDLWNQFYQVQEGTKKIDDILIRAGTTKQKPTRKPVVDFFKISFKQQWNCQKQGVFDEQIIRKNNGLLEKLKSNYSLYETRKGRKKEDEVTAHFTVVSSSEFLSFMEQTEGIFSNSPFDESALKAVLQKAQKVNLVFMDKNETRKRTFYSDGKIKVLQQGADNIDKEKANYLGDTEVLIDVDEINIQVHKIVPKKMKSENEEQILENFEQYMYAFFIPDSCDYYVRV